MSTLFRKWVFSAMVMLTSIIIIQNVNAIESDNRIFEIPFEDLQNLEITSTSYFPETPLDVAATVTVITAQNWQKRGARRFSDAISNLPGVVALPNYLGQSSIRIRGYAVSGARGISTLWDGVSINSFNLATADVDRPNIQLDTLNSIEVTRGPGSSMYGSDAFHGVIALNSFESDKNIDIVRTRVGSNGFNSASYKTSKQLNDDWRLNVSFGSSGQPNQNIAYSGSDGSGKRDYNFRSSTMVAKFISNPVKKMSYKVGLYYDDNNSIRFTGSGKSDNYAPQKDTSNTDSNLGMIKVDAKYQLTNRSSLSFESYSWKQKHVFEFSTSPTNSSNINGTERRDAVKLIYRHKTGQTQTSMAVNFRHDRIKNQHIQIVNANSILKNEDLPFSGTERRINSFLIDNKTSFLSNQLILRAGFRLDNYSDFGSQFTPRLGVIYQANKESVIKLLYGNSFRATNAIEVAGAPFIAGNPNIKPEELTTTELVYLKQTKNSKIELVTFISEWRNGITTINTGNTAPGSKFANVTKSSAYGVETTYNININKFLLESSGSYIRSKNDTDNVEYVAFPKFILNLGVGYNFADGYALFIQNRALLEANDSPILSPSTSVKAKKYGRMDINFRKSFKEKWSINFNIRNALNRKNFLPSLVKSEGGVAENGIGADIGLTYKL